GDVELHRDGQRGDLCLGEVPERLELLERGGIDRRGVRDALGDLGRLTKLGEHLILARARSRGGRGGRAGLGARARLRARCRSWGTLNCLVTGSAATSASVRSRNGSSFSSVAGSIDAGSEMPSATLAASPSLASTSSWPGRGVAVGVVVGLGSGLALGSGLGDGSGLALGSGLADGSGEALGEALGSGPGMSVVVLMTFRNRSCAGTPTCLMMSVFSPG